MPDPTEFDPDNTASDVERQWIYSAVVERIVDADTLDLAVDIWAWRVFPFPSLLSVLPGAGGVLGGSRSELDLGFKVYAQMSVDDNGVTLRIRLRERFRLLGVDTPEVYGIKKELRGPGEAASAYVSAAIPVGSDVAVQTVKGKGKFGRWLAVVWPDPAVTGDADATLNQMLLDSGHAKPYG